MLRRPWPTQDWEMAATRRGVLAGWSAAAAAAPGEAVGDPLPAAAAGPRGTVRIDPAPLFPLSPLLHMQFMRHLSLAPHNANPILMEWMTGVYHARALNTCQRHGARVAIATAADFNGTRWSAVAVRLQVPRGVGYLTPAGSVMRLFGRHVGEHAVAVAGTPSDPDVAASRAGNRIHLRVACTRYEGSVQAAFEVAGAKVAAGRVFEIAPADLRQAVGQDEPDVFAPKERPLDADRPLPAWRFPAGSVSVVELDLA